MAYIVLISKDGAEPETLRIETKFGLPRVREAVLDALSRVILKSGTQRVCAGFSLSVHPDSADCDHECHGCATKG